VRPSISTSSRSRIDERSFGPNHAEVASLVENTTVLLRQMGREKDAAPFEERASVMRSRQDEEG